MAVVLCFCMKSVTDSPLQLGQVVVKKSREVIKEK